MELVPTINIAAYRQGKLSPNDLKLLDTACRDHGFFLLTGHGLDPLIERMWVQTQRFFESPNTLKKKLQRTSSNPLGYYDRELTKQKRDLKEVFDFKAGGYKSKNSLIRSQWPEEMPDFKTTLSEYFNACTLLAAESLELVYTCLGLPTDQVELDYGDKHTSSMRLNYYPTNDPLTEQEQSEVNPLGDMALHHHTDPGTITLLIQDETGGLQTLSKAHGWIDVPPIKNTFVVNLGDALQVQTNDVYRAAVHRVLPRHHQGRYSTPYFYQPRYDAKIQPIPTIQSGPDKYQSFSWRDYIKARTEDNFADAGEEDIQIQRYRIS